MHPFRYERAGDVAGEGEPVQLGGLLREGVDEAGDPATAPDRHGLEQHVVAAADDLQLGSQVEDVQDAADDVADGEF